MKNKKVLIVDDDLDILEILSLILLEEGYDVTLSSTGEEAVNLKDELPDLLLMDLRLTGTNNNGSDICAKLKSQESTKNLPVIIVSAERDISDIACSCGADSFISKPFDIDKLKQTVAQYINQRKTC